MYLVTVISDNTLQHAIVFKDFNPAADHADKLILRMKGNYKLPHWQSGENYTHENGTTVTLIPIQVN